MTLATTIARRLVSGLALVDPDRDARGEGSTALVIAAVEIKEGP